MERLETQMEKGSSAYRVGYPSSPPFLGKYRTRMCMYMRLSNQHSARQAVISVQLVPATTNEASQPMVGTFARIENEQQRTFLGDC